MHVAAVNRGIGKAPSRGALLISLRVLTIVLVVGAVLSLLMLHRHRTVDSQVPIHAFFLSSYTMAISLLAAPCSHSCPTHFSSLREARLGRTAAWALDTPRRMVIACALAAGIIAEISWYILTTPPVIYTQLLDSILGGGSDNYRQAKRHVEKIASVEGGSDLYLGYTRVLDVLQWRHASTTRVKRRVGTATSGL